jgi:hypothetical protein
MSCKECIIKISVKEFVLRKLTYQKYNFCTDWSIGSALDLLESCIGQISAGTPVIMTKVFHDFPLSIQANAGIAP